MQEFCIPDYTHIFYALGGSEMPNGQNLRPIAARPIRCTSTAVTRPIPVAAAAGCGAGGTCRPQPRPSPAQLATLACALSACYSYGPQILAVGHF